MAFRPLLCRVVHARCPDWEPRPRYTASAVAEAPLTLEEGDPSRVGMHENAPEAATTKQA